LDAALGTIQNGADTGDSATYLWKAGCTYRFCCNAALILKGVIEMKNILKSLGLGILLATGSIFAAEGSKSIINVVPVSYADNNTADPGNVLFLYFNGAASTPTWSPAASPCSETRAYIRAEDKNLQAAFLTFYTSGKTITVSINSSSPLKNGGCQVMSIRAD
jgi:hypothetical protein